MSASPAEMTEEEGGLAEPRKRSSWNALIRPVDGITLGYLFLLGLLILAFGRRLPGWGSFAALHAAAIAAILWLVRAAEEGASRPLVFLRDWYPALLIFPLFSEMHHVTTIFFPFWANDWLIHLDHAMFGVHPTVWFEGLGTPFLTEIMVLFYMFYYIMLPAAGLSLYCHSRRGEFHNLMLNTMLSFYVSCAIFLLFPAESPRLTLAHLQSGPLQGWYFLAVLGSIQEFGGIHGGAFPSSHVAAAVAILFSVRRSERRLFCLMSPLVMGLAVSTVYCRYHYAADAIAGILVGLGCCAVGRRISLRWEMARAAAGRVTADRREDESCARPCGSVSSAVVDQRRNHVERTEPQVTGVRSKTE
jgi:membrane-associated phospholipid phosphatase